MSITQDLIKVGRGLGKKHKHLLGKAIFLGPKQQVPYGTVNIQLQCRRCGRRVVLKIGGSALKEDCDLAYHDRVPYQGPRRGRPADPESWRRRIRAAEARVAKHSALGRLRLAARCGRALDRLKVQYEKVLEKARG